MKKTQISVIELPMLFLLFGFALVYFNTSLDFNDIDYKLRIDSFLDSLYFSENFRNTIYNENLSSNSITSNWSNFSNLANSSFLKYELIISNNTISKTIFFCNDSNNKYFKEYILSIQNNTNFEFRKIKFGVCY